MQFSVIITVYNKSDVVLRTLDSVASQTFRDFEVIIVDDGSTDDSVDKIRKYSEAESWIRRGVNLRVITQDNSGASAARNIGVKAARGMFVAMLDGDDIWTPNHLEDLSDILAKYPEAKVLSTNSASVNMGVVSRPVRRANTIGLFNIFDYPYGNYPMNSDTIAVKRDTFIESGGYNTHFSYYEDREFYFRLAELVGDFHVNWRISAFYCHDAINSAHSGRQRRYAEYGYLSATEQMARAGNATARRVQCVRENLKMLLVGNAVRGRWDIVADIYASYPTLTRELPVWRCRNNKFFEVVQHLELVLRWILMRVKRIFRELKG